MQSRRFALVGSTALVAGVASACGALLGVDDVGYPAGSDAAADVSSSAADAAPDVVASAEAGDAGNAGDGAAGGDTGLDAAFTCLGVTAVLCADFEGPDPTTAYVNGNLGSGAFHVDTTGSVPALVTKGVGKAVELDVVALANSNEAGHARLQFQADAGSASNVHLEMDARLNIAPSEETGLGEIFFLKFPNVDVGCQFIYKYSGGQAHVFHSCAGINEDLGPFPGPFGGAWTHLKMDVSLTKAGLAMTFSNGIGGTSSARAVVGTLDAILWLGGVDDQGPAPAKMLAIDNVVLRID